MKVKSPAKVNLGLNIVSKREDGFHNLKTIFYPIIDLYDEITFKTSSKFKFICDSPLPDLSNNNLILKAVEILEDYTGKEINLTIELKKRIPVGAGLGGGSSNAAATLTTLNKLYKFNLSQKELQKLALKLGSDVPFFLNRKTAIGKSRGEKLSPINFKIEYPILLINPGIHISTKEAFANIIPKPVEFDYNKISVYNINELRKVLTNDFESFVFGKYPEIESIKNQLYSIGAIFVLMSGTGSTVYGIFKNVESAKEAYNLFPDNYFKFISRHV